MSAQINNLVIYYRCDVDENWTIKEISKSSEKILECDYSDIIANRVTFGQFTSKEDILNIKKAVDDAIIKKEPFQLVYEIKPNANKKLILEQGQAIYDEHGNAVELTGFITDITKPDSFQAHINIYTSIKMWLNEIKESLTKLKLKASVAEINTITDREAIIALYFSQGMSMKQIAKLFSLSPRTVEVYLYRIKSKLNCHTKDSLRRLFIDTNTGQELIISSIRMLSTNDNI
jgi:DNA-binding CsgD family transcriptional regulator